MKKTLVLRFHNFLPFLFLGILVFLAACQKQDMEELTGMPEDSHTVDDADFDAASPAADYRSSYVLVYEQNVWKSGWQLLVDGAQSSLMGKDVKVMIKPTNTVSFNSYAMPSWRTLQTGNANANVYTTREVLQSTLQGSEDHADFYSWAGDGTSYHIKVYARTVGGGGGGGAFNCAFNAPAFPGSLQIGIEAGRPVNEQNGNNELDDIIFPGNSPNTLIKNSGAKFVRLNFFRPTNYSQTDYSWLDTYDDIVCHFHEKNIPIYALVSDVVGGDGSADGYYGYWGGASQWIDYYVDAFEKIVQRYQGEIFIYESFNEPNVWVSPTGPAKMQPDKFAELLEETYQRLKPGGTNPYGITLVSGPLEAHDGYPQSGTNYDYAGAANYFNQVLNAGEQNHGWHYNYRPFDGIGYHIYVRKYSGGQWDLEGGIHESLEAIWDETNGRMPWNKRQLYISEVGWNAELMYNRLQGGVTSTIEAHANFISRGLQTLKNNSWRVKAVSFFSITSFNNGEGPGVEDFGLTRPDYLAQFGISPTGYKWNCWCVYQKMVINGLSDSSARSQCGVSNY